MVAPDSPQSGMGHAITINSTLRCTKVKLDDGLQQEYSCSGTPATVKLGVHEILKAFVFLESITVLMQQ